MVKTYVAALATLVVLVSGPKAWACDCAPLFDLVPAPSLDAQVGSDMRSAEVVFLGAASRRESGAVVFEVDAYWKGAGGRHFTTSGNPRTPGGGEIINDCEVAFQDKARYVVFVQRTAQSRLIASQCGFTRRDEDANEVIAALDRQAVRRVPARD